MSYLNCIKSDKTESLCPYYLDKLFCTGYLVFWSEISSEPDWRAIYGGQVCVHYIILFVLRRTPVVACLVWSIAQRFEFEISGNKNKLRAFCYFIFGQRILKNKSV